MAKFKYLQWLSDYLASTTTMYFEWDEGNLSKSFLKHGISTSQIEAALQDINVCAVGIQVSPRTDEDRFGVVGKDHLENYLFVCFTIRTGRIRPISARLANKLEKSFYE